MEEIQRKRKESLSKSESELFNQHFDDEEKELSNERPDSKQRQEIKFRNIKMYKKEVITSREKRND
jgi:hypothetical protein